MSDLPKHRAVKPDAQPFDRIVIDTVPRFKQSDLSGDEWRISARVVFYRKGRAVHEFTCRNVETATAFLPGRLLEALDDGKGFYAGERDACDQEGCAEKAGWRHALKARFDKGGHKDNVMQGGEYRLFCDAHKRRGDCGLDDADANYDVTPYEG